MTEKTNCHHCGDTLTGKEHEEETRLKKENIRKDLCKECREIIWGLLSVTRSGRTPEMYAIWDKRKKQQ